MEKIKAFLDGKKVYITAIIVFICGGLEASGVTIPNYVYTLLGAFGLTFVRSAITKSGPKV